MKFDVSIFYMCQKVVIFVDIVDMVLNEVYLEGSFKFMIFEKGFKVEQGFGFGFSFNSVGFGGGYGGQGGLGSIFFGGFGYGFYVYLVYLGSGGGGSNGGVGGSIIKVSILMYGFYSLLDGFLNNV